MIDLDCTCGHKASDHHTMLKFALNPESGVREPAGYVYGECEHYGFNEVGGMKMTWRGRLRYRLWNVKDRGRWVPGPWWADHCMYFEEA